LVDKLQDHLSYPPRAMRAERAAAYLAMSTSKFLQLVEEGRLPQPIRIDGIVSWDRFELDAAYDNFKDDNPPRRNTVDEALGIKR